MAILDKEGRRGLRMPSLSAMKLQKKSSPPSPESPPRKESTPVSAVPPPAFPARSDSVPVRPPRPQEKELPPNPFLPEVPAFPSAPLDAGAASPQGSSPAPAPFSNRNPGHPYNDRPLPSFPRVPVPKPAPASVPVQQTTPPPSDGSDPEPERALEPRPQPPSQSQSRSHPPAHHRPAPGLGPGPQPPRQPPVGAAAPYHGPGQTNGHGPEQEQDQSSGEDPLEDYIPDPEPELDGPGDPVSSEEDNGPWTPPDYDPVAAPLNKLHFSCYQEHRSMLPAANQWYPLPCMACQKFDRETRYRCVFCCLRVCGSCVEALRKCPNRSLEQLMENISTSASGADDKME